MNEHHSEHDSERDPQLARLLEAAGGERPPAALDAAIRAAAHKAVGARPQAIGARPQGGGGATAAPAGRAQYAQHVRRNWYVPVSIAAVLVLSVSLVTLVRQEKGDELAQRVPSARAPTTAPTPQATSPFAPDAQPPAPAAKLEPTRRDAAPAVLATEENRPKRAPDLPARAADGAAETPQTQSEKSKPLADSAGAANKVAKPESSELMRRDKAADRPPEPSAPGVAPSSPSAAMGGAAPSARVEERRPQAFPPGGEREAARPRSESASSASREAAPVSPPAAAPTPRQAPSAEDARARSAPDVAQERVTPPPPAVAAKPFSSAPARRAEIQSLTRPAWLTELENQPPEKWLERLAEFKRDGRMADADKLLDEFRRRFPEHPASAR